MVSLCGLSLSVVSLSLWSLSLWSLSLRSLSLSIFMSLSPLSLWSLSLSLHVSQPAWRAGGKDAHEERVIDEAPPCQECNVASEIRFERFVEMRGHV